MKRVKNKKEKQGMKIGGVMGRDDKEGDIEQLFLEPEWALSQ